MGRSIWMSVACRCSCSGDCCHSRPTAITWVGSSDFFEYITRAASSCGCLLLPIQSEIQVSQAFGSVSDSGSATGLAFLRPSCYWMSDVRCECERGSIAGHLVVGAWSCCWSRYDSSRRKFSGYYPWLVASYLSFV